MKYTIHTLPVNGGAFNCQPARTIELEDKCILTNNVILPWETNPHGVQAWIIGNEFGALGLVWAECAQYALDELVDAGLGAGLLITDPSDEDEENEDLARLGNAGELADLANAWICLVRLSESHDCRLLCAFAEARAVGVSNLSEF